MTVVTPARGALTVDHDDDVVLGDGRRHGPHRHRHRGDAAAPAGRDRAHGGRHRTRRRSSTTAWRGCSTATTATGTPSRGSTASRAGSGSAVRCSTRGNHAPLDEPARRRSAPPRAASRRARVCAYAAVDAQRLINPLSIRAFNEMWFRKAPRERRDQVQTITAFFHPLDAVLDWNRIYGSHGFVQYQFVVPYGAEHVVRTVLERLSAHGCASFLAVLKRFEHESRGDARLSRRRAGRSRSTSPVRAPRSRRSSTASTISSSRRAAACTSRRTRGCGPSSFPRCTRSSTGGARSAPRSTRTTRCAATWTAGSTSRRAVQVIGVSFPARPDRRTEELARPRCRGRARRRTAARTRR